MINKQPKWICWLGFLLTLVFFFPKNIWGQKERMEAQTIFVENPNPINQGSDITVDTANFVWIVGPDGLIRFDGHTYKSYQPYQKYGFVVEGLNRVYADAYGNLWIVANFGDIYIFDVKTEKAVEYKTFFGEEFIKDFGSLLHWHFNDDQAGKAIPYLVNENGEVFRYGGEKK